MTKAHFIRVAGTLMVLIAILWALAIQQRLGWNLYLGQFLYVLIALSTVVIMLRHPISKTRRWLIWAVDAPLGVLGCLAALYTVVRFPDLLDEANFRMHSTTGLAAAIIILTLLIEGVRRTAGLALAAIILIVLGFAIFAEYLPEPFAGRRFRPAPFLYSMAYQDGNVLGPPLAIVGTLVIAYILMGSVLQVTGGGRFFSDFAAALVGRSRGGSAKMAVTASGLFGTISGSAVSNVVSTGMITIPLMRKAGYRGVTAGGLEAIASTGGQLVPPVMGAVAFLMAVTAQVDYSAIVVAAILPSFLYYLGIYLQIDLIAGRDGIQGEGDAILRLGQVLKEGWVFPVPFLILIFGLFALVWRAEYAALAATLSLLVLKCLFPGQNARPTWRTVLDAMGDTAEASVSIVFIAAGAGIVIGALNSSGVLFMITGALLDLGSGNLPLLLLVSGALCIILGMGMPTVGVYALLSTLVAVPLVQLGIDKMAAHFFVLYFGMLSMITPPVAIAAFAAAAISGESAMRTGFEAMRLGWSIYVLPFIFVVQPALLMQGSAADVVVVTIRSILGIYLITAAMVGFMATRLNLAQRGLFTLVGVPLLLPIAILPGGAYAAAASTAIGLVLIALQFRRGATARPA